LHGILAACEGFCDLGEDLCFWMMYWNGEWVQVHREAKHLVNSTLVERYHVDVAAKSAIDRMQLSVSCFKLYCNCLPLCLWSKPDTLNTFYWLYSKIFVVRDAVFKYFSSVMHE